MGIVGRLDQYGSMLTAEFDDYSMSENLLTYSEQFNDNSWLKPNVSVSTNIAATTAPDGTNTVEKLIEDSTSNQHIAYKSRTGSNETLTFSVFVKAAERNIVWLQLSNFSSASANAAFTLSGSGTLSNLTANSSDYTNTSASIISYPNGWYRCILTATKGSLNTTNNPAISIGNNTSTIPYLGDGTSGLYIWGAQLETGSVATDYTPTTTTAKNRVLSSTTNTNITGFSTYFSSGFSENVGAASTLVANVFPPYQIVYDEFAGTLFGSGQGRYMRQNADKSVIVYNEIDEVTGFGNDTSFWLLGEQDSGSQVNGGSGFYSAGIFTSANIITTSGGTVTLSFTFTENVLNVIQGSTSYIKLYKNSSQIFQFLRSEGLTTTYNASYNINDVFYFETDLFVNNGITNPGIGTIAVTLNSSLVYKYTMTSQLD